MQIGIKIRRQKLLQQVNNGLETVNPNYKAVENAVIELEGNQTKALLQAEFVRAEAAKKTS